MTAVSPGFLMNAWLPMALTDAGIVTEVSELDWKAPLAMAVTELGITIEDKLL